MLLHGAPFGLDTSGGHSLCMPSQYSGWSQWAPLRARHRWPAIMGEQDVMLQHTPTINIQSDNSQEGIIAITITIRNFVKLANLTVAVED